MSDYCTVSYCSLSDSIASSALSERMRLDSDRQLLLDLASELAAGVDHSNCPTCRQLGECWYTLAVAKLDQMRGEK